jgi:hypothetical protein
MSKRAAKREACRIVALLIENYFDVGQPDASAADDGMSDDDPRIDKLRAGLEALRDELERRAGTE